MITIEQIDEFRKRTHSSYEDAKYYLERNNGDVLDAIIDFERSKTGRVQYREGHRDHNSHHSKNHQDYGHKFSDILQKGFDTRVFVEDSKSVLFNIPVILLLFLLPLWIIVVVMFVFFIMLGYKISIRDVKSQNIDVNAFFGNISEKMRETEANKPVPRQKNPPTAPASNKTAAPTDQPNPPEAKTGEQGKEDGYKEYTIE